MQLPDLTNLNTEALFNLISQSQDRALLEAIGRAISQEQFLDLLNYCAENKKNDAHKLSVLLVQMPLETFTRVLSTCSPAELQILQEMGKTEPLQHHLHVLNNALLTNDNEFAEECSRVDQYISDVDLNEASLDEVLSQLSILKQLKEAYQLLQSLTERGLSLAWHMDRPDLIERYNIVRSHCVNSINFIGHGGSPEHQPSGLFHKMADRLNHVFGDPKNPNDKDALRDEDSALEALAKLSVWHLEDYFDIGLFPRMKSTTELDLDPDRYSREERTEYRNKLFADAQERLHQLGLKTVADVKARGIFSKRTLKDYIHSQQSK